MARSTSRTQLEQMEVLGTELASSDKPKTVLGMLAWWSLWSMGKGAGASAFMKSPVALAARGHDVHLLQPCESGEEGVEEYGGVTFHKYRAPKVFSNPDQPLIGRLFERVWRYYYYQFHSPKYALRLAREINPDLIMAYGIMSAPAAHKVAKKLKLPFAGRYFGNTLSLALNNKIRWMGNFMERIGFTVPHDAMILTNDGSPVLEVLERLNVDLTPIHYLRNGIPDNIFMPGPKPYHLMHKLGIPDDAFVLMTVTRLATEKRLDRTIQILAKIRPEIPKAIVVMLGSGPEQPALEALAREMGVADAVLFPGPIMNNDLAEWYRMSDVVLSLLDRTNASNPVFEAMACEKCVLALDVGTTRDTVRNEETGILVSPDRMADIPKILLSLFRDPDRRAVIGSRARPFILDQCGTVKMRMMREISVLEELTQSGDIIPGNLTR